MKKRLNTISGRERRRGFVAASGPFAVAVVYLIVVIPLLVVALSVGSGTSVRSPRPALFPSPVLPVPPSPRHRVPLSPRPLVPPSPRPSVSASPRHRVPASSAIPSSPQAEYLWYEAENMQGFATNPRGEPIQNPSWLSLPKSKAPGWGINGPGVSAEWSQGGESEWNSAAASADETRASIYQDVEVPRSGDYKVWVRYADWANKTENFVVRIMQEGDAATKGHGDEGTRRRGDTGIRGRGGERTRGRGDTGRGRGDFASRDLPISQSPNLRVSASPGHRVTASPRRPIPASSGPPVTAFRHEFGVKDVIPVHDEVSMYWGWSFAWDGATAKLKKGPARLMIEIEKAAQARRHVDCLLVTNDLAYIPEGRRKPDFAAMRYLRQWARTGVPSGAERGPRPSISAGVPYPLGWRTGVPSEAERGLGSSVFVSPRPPIPASGWKSCAPLSSLIEPTPDSPVPTAWQRPKIADRDFLMPWNIAPEFWLLYDKPAAERPLYPFNAEPIEEFVQQYKGARDVPIFASRLIVPVIYLNNLPAYLKEGSPFLHYLRETKVPFAVLINYGSAQMSEAEGQAAWKLLGSELRDQFLGWISGESVGYVWDSAATDLKITSSMSRKELLEAHRLFYTEALRKKWVSLFHIQTGPMWEKMIPAQSTSSTSFAHALAEWGTRLVGIETAAAQPMTAMRIAFTRGAARQYGGAFLYYHAPNFGDTATTFTKTQNFAGPDNFFHSRYGPTMGPSLSWYRKSYYLYYMAGASAIYLEQGFDQFFKPGPGEHPFQLNPLGRITDEFIRFAEKHPDRGTPYTPVAFLLDPAHGWDMTDYPQWPFEVSQLTRNDRALRELFGVAYYPGTVVEGEPATGDRQAFVSGIFGDIFDVLVAGGSPTPGSPAGQPAWGGTVEEGSGPSVLASYRAVVVGGHIDWSPDWIQKLSDYVRNGGTVVLNAGQSKGLPTDLIGVHLTDATAEADNARCLSGGEAPQDLSGQVFRYQKIEAKDTQVLIQTPDGDPLVTINKIGKGKVVFCALSDLLGEDERATPFAAHMLAHLLADITPLRVSGDVEYLINRAARGWVVTLINNNGVFKPQQGMAQVDRSATVTATISLSGRGILSAQDWISDNTLDIEKQNGQDTVTVRIAPGGVAIVELAK